MTYTMAKTTEHQWIKHTMVPVQTLPNDEGEPVVFVDPDQQEIAEDNAVYGCAVCDQPMATHYNTECEGANE